AEVALWPEIDPLGPQLVVELVDEALQVRTRELQPQVLDPRAEECLPLGAECRLGAVPWIRLGTLVEHGRARCGLRSQWALQGRCGRRGLRGRCGLRGRYGLRSLSGGRSLLRLSGSGGGHDRAMTLISRAGGPLPDLKDTRKTPIRRAKLLK